MEKSGSDTIYVEASGLEAAFAKNSGNDGATFTLLANVEPNTYLTIQINCILNLGGHTITGHIGSNQCVCVDKNTAVTILGEGEIIAPNGIALAVDGSVTLEGGTYTSTGSEDFSHGVQVSQSATLSVTGEKVTIRNTGGGSGLNVDDAQSVQLSAGTYSGAKAIESIVKLSDMLAHTDNTRYAYYQNDIPVTKASAWVDNNIGDVPLDTPIAWLSDTVTVKACTHTYQYAHTPGTTTHSQTCPACGDAKDSEKCDFSNGPCPCGAVLAVMLPADLNLTYTGTEQEPAVTVTVDGTTTLTKDTDYTVAYESNVSAGENTAKVTVTGKTFTGTATLTFSIGKATPTITWGTTTQELPYTGNPAAIIAPAVTLSSGDDKSNPWREPSEH